MKEDETLSNRSLLEDSQSMQQEIVSELKEFCFMATIVTTVGNNGVFRQEIIDELCPWIDCVRNGVILRFKVLPAHSKVGDLIGGDTDENDIKELRVCTCVEIKKGTQS